MSSFASRGEVKHAYNVNAAEYRDAFLDELDRKPYDRALLESFCARVPAGWVADVGCGPAQIGGFIGTRRPPVVGADLSSAMATLAVRTPGVRASVAADMSALPFVSSSLAGLVAFYSVIHLERSSVRNAFGEFARVLRPDGSLIVAVHGGEGELHSTEWFGRPVRMSATLFSPDELRTMATSAGLEVERCDVRDPYDSEHKTKRIYLSARSR